MKTASRLLEAFLLLLVLILSFGLSLGLTYVPCYASLCSEDFFPDPTRFHVATYFALLASTGCVLLLRTYSPLCNAISNFHLTQRRLPVLDKRISIGGLCLSLWLVGVTIASTGFWYGPEHSFWGLRTDPLRWADAQVRLTVTGIIGHHADIVLGLVLIPVSRNSILGRVFEVHQSTLLYAHKLLAYILFVAVLAHGAATYTFVATYAAASDDSPRKDAFNVDNPTLTAKQTETRGSYHSATLGTGMISLLLLIVIGITALPALRRRSYNTFYYAHLVCSTLIFVGASIHASTDFYFLLPGLILWLGDWVWRLFRGDSGIRKRVDGRLENAGNGWFRITLPASAKVLPEDQHGESQPTHRDHPLQTYYLNVPSISKVQNHAFTAAKIGSSTSGPVFLFQRAQGPPSKKEQKLEKEWTWKAATMSGEIPGNEEGITATESIEVRAEGPYVPTEVDFYSADHIVCIVGGTGITGAYSLALWWLEHRAQKDDARFTLVWSVRHKVTAQLSEWLELEKKVQQAGNNIQLKVHVSSEDGRIDAVQTLRDSFATREEKESVRGQTAWIYVSGPAGLLDQAEDACIDLERELKKARKLNLATRFSIRSMEHYVAKWEV